ncbi:hypothetical protein [Plesiomonas sp. ZOR0011]|uniref:hypothetical protein n=1 Tax=Plesiomonas sp. ZOR0011 TaxID=1339230 RepID=UPI0012E03800|nr:hypothetical protein [Plesiomonas sp. ZOR0011]
MSDDGEKKRKKEGLAPLFSYLADRQDLIASLYIIKNQLITIGVGDRRQVFFICGSVTLSA